MKNNIKIRLLNAGDSERELIKLFGQLTSRDVEFDVKKVLGVPNLYCYVVEVDKKNIGFAALTLRFVPTKGYVGVIEDVVIDENYRQMGLGTKLIKKLLDKGNNLKVFAVELTSNPKRESARRLYQKLGFELLETGVFRFNFRK